jgi:NADH:ubiquinone oxidoreductase subunit K
VIPHESVLVLSALLFLTGAVGALLRRNLIVVLMCIELMFAAAVVAWVGFDRMWAARAVTDSVPVDGRVFALIAVVAVSAQLAIGLAILVSLVRNRDSMDVEDARLLRW